MRSKSGPEGRPALFPLHLLALFAVLGAASAAAQPAATPAPRVAAELTVDQIMAKDWIGTFPENPYWADDGRSVYYTKRRPGGDLKDLRRVDLATGKDELVGPAALAAADHAGVWSRDRRLKAWVRAGDLWVREPGRRAPRQLTRTTEVESAPLPLLDGRVAFRRGDSFFAVALDSGRIDTLFDLRFGKDPDEVTPPDRFLTQQQRRLHQVLAERAARAEEARRVDAEARSADGSRAVRPTWLPEGKVLLDATLSPTGRQLLAVVGAKPEHAPADSEDSGGGKPDEMPVFVTDSGYVEVKKVRPKVGTGAPKTPELFLIDLGGRPRPVALDSLPGLTDDPLADLRAKSEYTKGPATPGGDAAATAPKPSPRAVRFDTARWSDDGTALAVQLFSHDSKDRWLLTVAPTDGAAATIHRQTDPAWLGWSFTSFGWMRDGKALWYLSEESGFSHLYVQAIGGARRALTQGPFEVDEPVLSRDGRSFFVSANREQAGTYEIYRVAAGGGPLERLTAAGGMTSAVLSSDEKQLLLTSSWTTKPPELFVQPARAGAPPKRLTKSTTPEFDAVAWVAPEIVEIPSTHFAGKVQSRVYELAGVRPAANAPAVIFIHGAGYLQNAHAGWSGYFREFMFHTLLARRGYVVLDMDYRASAGYGRDHRTAIYRQMGWPEVEDLEDGVDWLVANRGVDRARVGTYGGSYGGFLTFMAMFRKPELFAAGAALRPVTDWAHYNHGYTSAILNTPEVDPEAYRRSSPIEFAEGLAKPLLICHGMVDDNVTFQDSVRLVQRLIELRKTDLFETAIYPVEPHAFTEAASWADEYKRILGLFETWVRPLRH